MARRFAAQLEAPLARAVVDRHRVVMHGCERYAWDDLPALLHELRTARQPEERITAVPGFSDDAEQARIVAENGTLRGNGRSSSAEQVGRDERRRRIRGSRDRQMRRGRSEDAPAEIRD